MTTTEFIHNWDEKIREWSKNGEYHEEERYWFVPESKRKHKHKGLLHTLMPEPYWGNPEDCSCVVLNLNPGAGGREDLSDPAFFENSENDQIICGLMSGNYSSIANPFHCLIQKGCLCYRTTSTTGGGIA